MNILKPLTGLKKYLLQHKSDLIIGLIFIVLANILYAMLPRILEYTINQIKNGIDPQKVAMLAGLIVLTTALYSLFRFFMRIKIIGVAQKLEYQLRNDYFQHLQKLCLKFYVNNRTGDLMARATNDIRAVAMTIGRGVMFLVSNSLVFIFVFILMFTTDVKLTLLCLIPFPLVIFIFYRTMRFFYKIFERIQAQFSDITTKAQENISGIRVIKAYNQEEFEIQQFKELNEIYKTENLKLAKIRGFMWASMEMLFGISFLVLLWVGGNEYIAGRFEIGTFVAFTVWLGMLSWPMISFGWILNLIQRASASMNRLSEIMDSVPEIQDTDACNPNIQTFQGDIQFKNLSFAYDSKMVLKNINLKITQGSTLAIIGPTGSGKTTFINLIARLIDSTEGEVLIDEHDIRSIPLKTLRKHIGYVPQETFLFSETIGENIAFGVDEAPISQIEWAAKISAIRDDLENFPDKYQTIIGERGVNLSGGQKQRTAIARALMRKPKILILDDALSSVDTYTEEKIIQSLHENYFNQTNIIISHRISTVKHADLIIVLENGKIIEQGAHEELVKLDGFYSELYQQQLLEQALEEM